MEVKTQSVPVFLLQVHVKGSLWCHSSDFQTLKLEWTLDLFKGSCVAGNPTRREYTLSFANTQDPAHHKPSGQGVLHLGDIYQSTFTSSGSPEPRLTRKGQDAQGASAVLEVGEGQRVGLSATSLPLRGLPGAFDLSAGTVRVCFPLGRFLLSASSSCRFGAQHPSVPVCQET